MILPAAHLNLPFLMGAVMLRKLCRSVLVFVLFVSVAVGGQGLNTSAIDQALGRSGQKVGEVYRVGFARTDRAHGRGGLEDSPAVHTRAGRKRETRGPNGRVPLSDR